MTKEEIIATLVKANEAYRLGDSIMEDSEYDNLMDQLREITTEDEYETITSSLNEGSVESSNNKVKHPFILGSLNKLKYDEPDKIEKYVKKYLGRTLNISAKIDGISCRLHYENGVFTQGSTRGNGFFGVDITDKLKFVKGVPERFGSETIDIRGELVITRSDFTEMSGFANPRNACAGIMNRKDFSEDELKRITFVAYTILGPKYTKKEQFDILSNSGLFNIAWNTELNLDELKDGESITEILFNMLQQDFEYDVDGLVVTDTEYRNEDKYKPDRCIAFKINQLVATTRIIDVVFQGPSKDGIITPVAILEPVVIAGSNINKASLHNNDFIRTKNIKYGSVVEIIKAGDIIPHVLKVVKNESVRDIILPETCPCCGTNLVETNLYVICPNKECRDQTTYQTQHFLEKLDINNVSYKRLSELGLFTIHSLVTFTPRETSKIETKLYKDLGEKMFSRSKRDLFLATNFEGIAKKILNKIFDFYGFEAAVKHENLIGLPVGVGTKTMEKFLSQVDENMKIVDEIVSDPRYSYVEKKRDERLSAATFIGSICFTGSLATMGRKEASSLAERNGFEVKNSVTKGLTYLVTNDPNSGSSKNEKAKKLGTIVIGEAEFLKLMNSNGMNVDDL